MKKNNVKFNFVDVAIAVCLIVVVLAVSVYFVMSKQGAGSGTAQEFSYSILFREVTEEVANSIKKDAFIYDGNKNINIGKISDIEIKDCTKYEFDGVSGEFVNVEVPEKYDVTLDISASGNSGDLSYSIDDFEIYVGKGVDIKSFGFVAHGFVVSVDEE